MQCIVLIVLVFTVKVISEYSSERILEDRKEEEMANVEIGQLGAS